VYVKKIAEYCDNREAPCFPSPLKATYGEDIQFCFWQVPEENKRVYLGRQGRSSGCVLAVRTWTEDGMHSTSFCNKNDQIEYIKSHFGQSPVMMILSYHNIIQ